MSRPGDVYRRAAKWLAARPLDSGDGMCDAIGASAMPNDCLAACRKVQIFCRSARPVLIWWGAEWSRDDLAKRRECRLLALCFAAAMADEGDL